MDIEGFLLTSGFALLVVLVGWSNQITNRSRETRELEQEFIDKARMKRKDYKKIINKKSAEKSIYALVDFLYSKREESEIDAFDKITKIRKDLPLLNKKYSHRFYILLITSISLIVSSVCAYYLPEQYKIYTILGNLIFFIMMIVNLIATNNLEKRYSENIHKTMEEL
jgi:uncharacterized membrane protein